MKRTPSNSGCVLCLVLGRAGSRGLPGKNMAEVAGRPCAAWTIDDAKRSSLVRRTVVSTDDKALALMAKKMGVRAVERPADLATDSATVDAAARDAYERLESDDAFVVILYANVPVRPRGLIDRAVQLLIESGADSVQSYSPVGKHHPWWTVRIEPESAVVRPWEGDVLNHGVHRRQDLPDAYIPDGGVLALRREALLHRIAGAEPGPHVFLGRDRRGVVNPEGSVVDIDTEIDRLVADAMLRRSAAERDAEPAEGAEGGGAVAT